MNLRIPFTITAAILLCTVAAYAQQGNATLDTPYQVRYAANVSPASPIDSFVNITNTGARGAGLQSGTAASITGAICANVYAFSPDEQMISCCSCPVTPNGLRSLSAKRDLVNNTLTPAVPGSIVVKILGSVPVGGSCAGSAAAPGALTSGLVAWGTTAHAAAPGGVPTAITETPFVPATLSRGDDGGSAEYERLTQLCTFIIANGSGFGLCNSCQLGALGGARR
jgi:hypothetical protein